MNQVFSDLKGNDCFGKKSTHPYFGHKVGVVLCVFVAVLFLCSSAFAYAQAPAGGSHQITLTSPNAQTNGYFGTVSLGEDLAVVGAHAESADGYQDAGRAYVFNTTDGKLVSSLGSPEARTAGDFGESVAISGDLVVVGAPEETSEGYPAAGNAYVFNALTGDLISALTSPNSQDFGYFGWSVAMSGNIAVVGAYGEGSGGNPSAGNVYVFNADTGSLISSLTSPNGLLGGSFGWSVSVSGKSILVGAPYENAGRKYEAGNAYMFNAKTGKLVRTFSNPEPKQYGAFGFSVAISGGIGIVSASGIGGEDIVYAFNSTTGTLMSKLGSNGDHGFGWSVGISGMTVVVGAPFETVDENVQAGYAYTFNATSGKLMHKYSAPTPQAFGFVGLSVSVSGKTIAVGAPNMTADGVDGAGQAYIFY